MNRPTSVTVLGILGIVLGVLGVLGALSVPFSLMALAHLSETAPQDTPATSGVALAWMYLSVGLKLVGTAALLTAGIGLLRLRPWARILTLSWAGYAIFIALVDALIAYTYVAKPAVAEASGSTVVATGMIARIGFSLVSGTLLPILFIVFMCRRPAIEAFGKDSGIGETFAGPAPWERLAALAKGPVKGGPKTGANHR